MAIEITSLQQLSAVLKNNPLYIWERFSNFILLDPSKVKLYDVDIIEDVPDPSLEPLSDFSGTLYVYDKLNQLYNDLLINWVRLDINKGKDDQFFDYNPALVESIVIGIYKLPTIEDKLKISKKLITHLKDGVDLMDDKDMKKDYTEQYIEKLAKDIEGYKKGESQHNVESFDIYLDKLKSLTF